MNKFLPLVFVSGALLLQGCSNGGGLTPGNPSSSSSSDDQTGSSVSSYSSVSSSIDGGEPNSSLSSSTPSSDGSSNSSDPIVPPVSSSSSSSETTSSNPSPSGSSFESDISESATLSGSGEDILEQLLNLLGAEAFEQFENDLRGSGFDTDQLGTLLGGLTKMFGTLDATQDQLTDLLTVGSGATQTVGGDGFSITTSKQSSLSPIVLTVDFDGIASADSCSASCEVAIVGTISGSLGNAIVEQGGDIIIIPSLELSSSSFTLSNEVSSITLNELNLGLPVIVADLTADPITVDLGSEGDNLVAVDLLDVKGTASNNGIDVDLLVNGTVGLINAAIGDEINVGIIDPDITLSLSYLGGEVPVNSSSVDSSSSSEESSSSSEESSTSSTEEASSSSETSSDISSEGASSSEESSSSSNEISSSGPVEPLVGTIDESYVIDESNDGLADNLLNLLGADEVERFSDDLADVGFDMDQLGILFGGLTKMFGTLDATQDELTDLLTVGSGATQTVGGDGFSITTSKQSALSPIVLTVDFDGVASADSCSASCEVTIAGTISGSLGNAIIEEGGDIIIIPSLELSSSSFTLSNEVASIALNELSLALPIIVADLTADPITVDLGSEGDNLVAIELLDLKGTASNNGVDIDLLLGGTVGLINASIGDEISVGLTDPSIDYVLDVVSDGAGSQNSSGSSSSSSESSVSSSSSEPVQAQGDVANGADLYASGSCSGCHGADAQGGAVAPESIAGESTAAFRAALSNQFMNSIELSEQEILDIGAYLESL